MGDELTEWATFQRATGAAVATIHIRIQVLRQLMRHAGKASPVGLNRRDVLAYMARDIEPWTRVTYWRCICAWDNWAREFGYVEASIVQGIPAPKRPRPVARPLTDDEIRTLLATPTSRRAKAYITLGLFAGLRVHEIARIRGEHLDHEAGWLRVKGKGGAVENIPIHPRVAELSSTYPEVGYWFIRANDPREPVDPRAVSATVTNVMAQCGIKATAHQLRDSLATKMQRENGDIRLVQALLRHRDVSTTMKYVGVADARLQRAVAALDWHDAA